MHYSLGSGTSYQRPISSNEYHVYEVKVNSNGGMGGSVSTFYIERKKTNPFTQTSSMVEVKDILGHKMVINIQWISIIKEKKLVRMNSQYRQWHDDTRTFTETDKMVHQYFVMNEEDDFDLNNGSNESNLKSIILHF